MFGQFPICILTGKGPFDTPALGVTSLLPSGDFAGYRGAIWQTAVKTLAVEDADFNLGHIEPTGVFGRI